MGRSKRPSFREPPRTAKVPKVAGEQTHQGKPTWLLSSIDFDGPWCWTELSGQKKREIYRKLGDLELRSWADIAGSGGGGAKRIPVTSLARVAQKRLIDINSEDIDGSLWEFRFSGKERIWGIRRGDRFDFLWWDPNHEVCPSKLKHT